MSFSGALNLTWGLVACAVHAQAWTTIEPYKIDISHFNLYLPSCLAFFKNRVNEYSFIGQRKELVTKLSHQYCPKKVDGPLLNNKVLLEGKRGGSIWLMKTSKQAIGKRLYQIGLVAQPIYLRGTHVRSMWSFRFVQYWRVICLISSSFALLVIRLIKYFRGKLSFLLSKKRGEKSKLIIQF